MANLISMVICEFKLLNDEPYNSEGILKVVTIDLNLTLEEDRNNREKNSNSAEITHEVVYLCFLINKHATTLLLLLYLLQLTYGTATLLSC